MNNISISDRDAHLRAVVKSNMVGIGLGADVIERVTQALYCDILDVLTNYANANQIITHESEEE